MHELHRNANKASDGVAVAAGDEGSVRQLVARRGRAAYFQADFEAPHPYITRQPPSIDRELELYLFPPHPSTSFSAQCLTKKVIRSRDTAWNTPLATVRSAKVRSVLAFKFCKLVVADRVSGASFVSPGPKPCNGTPLNHPLIFSRS